MKFLKKKIAKTTLIRLYQSILKPRLIEEKMLLLLRQGGISKWFSGIGQEAISVGSALAMQEDDYILPMHRNLGVFTARNIPLEKLFAQFQGKPLGYTKGRDRSFHFGTKDHHIVGMISHLGATLPVGNGLALKHALKKDNNVVLAFIGDGGTSEGDFHEALNVAAVWELPIIFIVENNGYALSTPNTEQFKFKNFTDKGIGYGIDSVQIDGNNILEVYDTISTWSSKIRKKSAPLLIEAITFRMRGHEEASGTKYVPKDLFEKWAKKDPVETYESYLIKQGVIDYDFTVKTRNLLTEEIEEAWNMANDSATTNSHPISETKDMFKAFQPPTISPKSKTKAEKRFVDAISDGLNQGMKKFSNLIIMGQDVAEYGGVFKATEGFVEQFGKERIRNTPVCESAILGMGLGLSIENMKSVVEMQFADFVTCGFNQIVNNIAKSHYRWEQNADLVIRMPCGGGVGAGPFHSQSNEGWFFHTPGLKIVYPSNPYDAKGLLLSAIEDPNPVMFFEHKALYRSIKENIPNSYYTEEIGSAKLITKGEDLSIISYGMGIHWAKKIISSLNKEISIDLLDLRSLCPWDKEAVAESVKKTGKVLIIHEDNLTGGVGAEIGAWISEHCFEYLDAPVMREASLDTAIPFATSLEKLYLPIERIEEKINDLISY